MGQVDGDQLNCVDSDPIINAAKRTIKRWNTVPLFYDAIKADPEVINREAMFKGLKRAYEFGNIGEIANMLTRLWNNKVPDVEAAECLVRFENMTIEVSGQ